MGNFKSITILFSIALFLVGCAYDTARQKDAQPTAFKRTLEENTQQCRSSIEKAENNLSLGLSTVIEHATGGSGNDKLVGNGSSNILTGNGGDDTLVGQLGTDTMIGGRWCRCLRFIQCRTVYFSGFHSRYR